jgi:hypothetical protein
MSQRFQVAVIGSLLLAAIAGASEEQAIRVVDRASAVATIDLRLHRDAAPDLENEEVEPPPMPLPDHLPVPAAFARRAAPAPQPLNAFPQLTPATESVSIVRSFLALNDNNGTVPPDTSGAAGPNHLVVALNTQIRFQDRSGTELLTTSLRTFFEGVRNGGRVFDPHVAYDPRTGHWMLCATTDQRINTTALPTGSALVLGVSKTGDPLGSWDLYRYEAPASVWFDFPQLGFNDSTIAVSLNDYAVSDSKFVRASVLVINKANPATGFTLIESANNGGGLAPVISFDAGSAMYLVQRWNGNSAGTGYVRLYSLSQSGITPIAFISTPTPWMSSGAAGDDFAPQAGLAQKISAGDDRILSPVLRNGSIWAVQTIFVPVEAPARAATQWWQISPTGALLQHGVVEDPSGAFFYAFPSIAVNVRNAVVISGTRFSATTFPSAFFVYGQAGNIATTTPAPVIYKAGEAAYAKVFSTSNRWGDYSTACVDPLNDTDFWTIQEYSATPSGGFDRWGTWWVQIRSSDDSANRRRAVKH